MRGPTTRLERVAIHEAGHALVQSLSPLLPPVRIVLLDFGARRAIGGSCHSVLGVSDAEGMSQPLREERLRQKLAALAAGALAEQLAFGNHDAASLSDGVDGDSERVREIEALLPASRREALVESAHRSATEILIGRWGSVERLAEHLLKCAQLPGELVRILIETTPTPQPLPPIVAAKLERQRCEFFAGLDPQ